MKYSFSMALLYKFQLIVACLLAFTQQTNFQNFYQSPANVYKEDSNVRHSLFRERDSLNRLSVSVNGIPEPKGADLKDSNKNDPQDMEKLVAKRIVIQYREAFDYLDYIEVDEKLSAEEFAEAFNVFNWPKTNPEITDNIEYAKTIIKDFDDNKNGAIDFVEFCKFMEDLWRKTDLIEENKCYTAFEKAKGIFTNLFKWLDRDQDNLIGPDDFIFGVSALMVRDVDLEEVHNVFNGSKLNLDQFLLAIGKGQLDNSLKDPSVTAGLSI